MRKALNNLSVIYRKRIPLKGMYRYCLFITALLYTQTLMAQADSLRFSRLGLEDGLPDAAITAIVQDAEGFLWLSTTNGLSRYDGTAFRNFFHDSSKNSLPGNHIQNIVNYDADHLVIATTSGLALLNTRTLQFRNFLVNSKPFMFSRDNNFRALAIDANKNIWAGTRTTLYCLNAELKVLKTFRGYSEKDYNRLRMNYVSDIGVLQGNEILACLQKEDETGELYIYNPQKDSLQKMQQLPHHPLRALNNAISTYWNIDEKGAVRIVQFLTDSLIYFNPLNQTRHATRLLLSNSSRRIENTVTRIINVEDQLRSIIFQSGGFVLLPPSFTGQPLHVYLPEINITAVKKDKDGNLWVGSTNGLYKAVGTAKGIRSVAISSDTDTTDWQLENISFVNDTVWLSSTPSGFFLFSKDLNALDHVVLKGHAYENITWYALQSNARDTLWLSTQSGMRWYHQATRTFGILKEKGRPGAMDRHPVLNAFRDSKGLIWMGIGFGNGVANYDPANRTFSHYPPKESNNPLPIRHAYAIAEDNESNLWMGNVDGVGLARWKRNTNTFELIPQDYYSTFDNASIFALLCNRKPTLWAATGNGLFRYHIPSRLFSKYTAADGLPSSSLTTMTEDSKGRLWIGTSNGISCFLPEENKFMNFMYPNALPEPKVANMAYDSSSGKIFFITQHYLSSFNPDSLLAQRPVLSLKITDVRIGNTSWPIQASYRIPYTQNDISLGFTAINFSDGPLNRYFYRIDHKNWIPVGNQRQISFLNLPPGEYAIAIKAVNNSGIWSNETSIHFTILHPWWKKWWVLTAAILIAAAIITWLVKRRIKGIRSVAGLKQKMTEIEMQALRAQMNPHFIFNCINSIDGLIQSNDKYHATVYLNKFAKLLRNILDSSRQNTVTLAKDLETLQLYIDLEQLRNENKFTVQIEADESLLQDDYKVPPLIVQPYVENAIIHGLKNRPDNEGRLFIRISHRQDHIEYLIEDNGVGREAFKSNTRRQDNSYGMQMSRDRIRFFNNEETASVSVTDLKKGGKAAGTIVKVLLKIQ